MSENKHIMIPAGFGGGKVSTVLAGVVADNLGEGIKSGFGIIGYKGKVWSTKFQGKETALMRADGDGPRNSIDVIIVKASPHIAKIFYESGFVDGSTAPPDCWSSTGITPDGAAPKKQSTTCAGCPKNAWGSKITEAGKQTKACSDSKRIAVVPLEDPKNELMGGPMLLRVPAATLKDLKEYGDQLQAHGYPYYAVATKIGFDPAEAFPKFTFAAIRVLNDAEAQIVVDLRDAAITETILNTSVEVVHHEPDAVAAPVATSMAALAGAPTPAATYPGTAGLQASHQTTTTPVQPVAVPSPAGEAPAGAKPPRARRTRAQMEAAAAELKAKREGTAVPAQVTQAATPAVEQAAAVSGAENIAETAPASEDFEKMLDSLDA